MEIFIKTAGIIADIILIVFVGWLLVGGIVEKREKKRKEYSTPKIEGEEVKPFEEFESVDKIIHRKLDELQNIVIRESDKLHDRLQGMTIEELGEEKGIQLLNKQERYGNIEYLLGDVRFYVEKELENGKV